MSLYQVIAFSVASLVLLAFPGPTNIIVVSRSLSHGTQATFALLTGIGLGDLVTMTASLLGLGALLAASAHIFSILKILGAAYLIYLGVKMWREAPNHLDTVPENISADRRKTFVAAFTVTALNPKSIVFFMAFVPQFLNPAHDIHMQMAIFIGIFVATSVAVSGAYAIAASILRTKINISSIKYHADRTGGGSFSRCWCSRDRLRSLVSYDRCSVTNGRIGIENIVRTQAGPT